jgi:hypothetical protein
LSTNKKGLLKRIAKNAKSNTPKTRRSTFPAQANTAHSLKTQNFRTNKNELTNPHKATPNGAAFFDQFLAYHHAGGGA